ncbi:MAG: SDR family NAD(P)-dependent oxidoreductase, partial [Stackebrandtia sp.]
VHRCLREVTGVAALTVTRAVWLRPVFVSAERTVEVAVTATADNSYTFEVRSTDADGGVIVHSRGSAHAAARATTSVDLQAIRERCPRHVAGADHYARFTRIGVLYGPYFQTVKEIRVGDTEVLARLEHDIAADELPAGVLDGAIQSVAALQPKTDAQRPHVPFAMDEVHFLRPVPPTSFAHVRASMPGECTVTIVDDSGEPCIVINGLSYRELKQPVQTRLYGPQWRRLAPPHGAKDAAAPGRVLVVAPVQDHGLADRLVARHLGADVRVVRLEPDGGSRAPDAELLTGPLPDRLYYLGGLAAGPDDDADRLSLTALDRSQELAARGLFGLVKALLRGGMGERPLDLVTVTGDVHQVGTADRTRPFAASLFGLVRSLAKEQPKWQVRCVDIAVDELVGADAEAVADAVVSEPAHPRGNEVALRAGQRWTRVLTPLDAAVPSRSPFRAGGTYLILGGAGGIGSELALHLARRAAANVILLGRRPVTKQIRDQIKAIDAAGGKAIYLDADVTDDDSVTNAVAVAKQHFGVINGAFHSALVLRDGRIEGMDEATFDAALAPKVRGAVVLARALRDEPLDSFVFFSSAQSFSGNEGQSNYAAACTFKDAFALDLATAGIPVHIVNWGYWGEVGVVAKPGYRRRMQSIGVHSIQAEEGMRALETMLANGIVQAMVLKAEQHVLEKFEVSLDEATPPAEPPDPRWHPLAGITLSPEPDGDRLRRAHTELGALGVRLLLPAMQQLGVFRQPGERRSAAQLRTRCGVVAAHTQLWDTLINLVADAGLLRREGDELVATAMVGDLARRDLAAEGRRLRTDHPEVAAHVELLEVCLQNYPRLLRGEISPTEVMFPNSSMARVEGIYRGDPLSDRLNELAAQAVAVHLATRPADAPLRVLEVGAGTGGTTTGILATLAPHAHRVDYVYTDVSLGFLRHGRRTFGPDHPYLTFKQLNIETDPAEQGFERGSADIVVAANVLHATRNLRTTLDNVGYLLADGGWLVISETTAFSPFATLTFGLLDGWWRWTDGDLRIPGSPLVTVRTWTELLREAGFARTAAHEPARCTEGAFGQQVLVS